MTDSAEFATGRILVVAFEGWNDAGEAASGAIRALQTQLDLKPVAAVDPEDYFDYQFNRPTVALDDNGNRELTWPSVTMYGPTTPPDTLGGSSDLRGPDLSGPDLRGLGLDADVSVSGSTGTNVYLLVGTEPSRAWKSFTAEILGSVDANGITGMVCLSAMLADVPHTRPISVFTSSENADVRDYFSVEKSTYEGPVGILSALSYAAEKAGIPTLSIWASVPHYVHNAPSPKATLALIDKLEEVIDVVISRGELVDEAAAWESGIDALASDDDDMSSYIEQLEQARDTVDSPEASGEAIAQEFERYLRRGEQGKGEPGSAGEDPWRPKE